MKLVRFSLLFLLCAVVLGSCLKRTFDAPPDSAHYDPNLPVQMSIKQLSQNCVSLGANKYRALGDTTIYGVVVANDQSGNYYKQIVIEDTSGIGIVLYIDNKTLYVDYPVGKKIYVKLNGLFIYNYNGYPEIISGVDAAGKTIAIPASQVSTNIITANYPNTTVQVKDVSLADVKANPSAYLGSLVRLSNVEFDANSTDTFYAEAVATASATNRTIVTCDGSASAIIRTSAYSNFQSARTPKGNGTVTAIVSVFGTTLQFTIRDTTDVSMTNQRCSGGGATDPNLPVQMTLKQLSQLGLGLGSGKYRVMGDTTVYGVVVGNDKSGNIYKNLIIEDTSKGGMVIYIDNTKLYNDYYVGQKVYVKLKGLYLYNYSGLPEIISSVDGTGKSVPIPSGDAGKYIVKGNYPNTTVTATAATLSAIKSNPSAYLSSLVTMSNVQFDSLSKGVVYANPATTASATNRTIETCDHLTTAIVRTSGYANFISALTPTGNGTITAIVSIFNGTLQFTIRDQTDVSLTGTRCN